MISGRLRICDHTIGRCVGRKVDGVAGILFAEPESLAAHNAFD